MPNLPVRIGKGAVGLYQRQRGHGRRAVVTGLMATLGHAEWFEDETTFQLAGHLTGAGPAFLFRFIDALAAAAERLGLPFDQAQRLALQMVEGAAALARGFGRRSRDARAQGGEPRRHHRGRACSARRGPRPARSRRAHARRVARPRPRNGRRGPRGQAHRQIDRPRGLTLARPPP